MIRYIAPGIGTLGIWSAVCFAVLFAMGCESTYQLRGTETSGFLEDYSMLKEGEGEDPLLVYINPEARFSKYDAIMLDPVTVYAVADSDLHSMSADEQTQKLKPLVDYLDATLREQLSEDYRLTDRAGPGTIRLRVAITEAESAMILLDTVSTVVPAGIAVSVLEQAVTGKGAFVGDAGIEAELLDSQTGERLAAGVDRRAGRKATAEFDKFEKWHAAKNCFDYWAQRLKTRLKEEREKQGG